MQQDCSKNQALTICRFVLLMGILAVTLPSHSFSSEMDEEDLPLLVNFYPQNPTDQDWIILEGILQPSPPIQEVELLDYKWISENEFEINLKLIPGDFVPPKPEREYFVIRLEPLKAGEYSFVFKAEGNEIHRIDVVVEKGLTKFPVDLQLVPTQRKGSVLLEITGEYPSGGYSLIDKTIVTNEKQVLVSVEFEEPSGPAISVIIPFKESIGEIQLIDGHYEVILKINNRIRTEFPILMQNGQIIERTYPEPVPDKNPGPLLEASLRLESFELNVGETAQAYITGYFPSTAYSIEEETVRIGDSRIVICWVVNEEEIGDTVLVPIEKKYEFTDLKPGNYIILLQINDIIVTESKFFVRGSNLEPTKDLPFQAGLRVEYSGRNQGETSFLLVGKFPTPGYTFTEKTVEIVDNQITVTATIEAPVDPQVEVITSYQERMGTLTIPDLWERTYNATAIVNGVQLDPIQVGGKIIDTPISYPWNWIDVKVDAVDNHLSGAEVFLVGEFPSPGYLFYQSALEIVGNQINIWVDMIFPSDFQAAIITPFNENIGRLLLENESNQTYELNIFVNGNRISNRVIEGNSVITPVWDWMNF